jgi:hypothetical protein
VVAETELSVLPDKEAVGLRRVALNNDVGEVRRRVCVDTESITLEEGLHKAMGDGEDEVKSRQAGGSYTVPLQERAR